ncbi:unnamed protein product [Adineta steineri]|uniref:Uncharacterized protein n=1 Tax=Adineta steineri TaxID=433720 RepID=A0A813TEF6_9BILA|nr:unnamed protein product [Adineta steineri]
MGSKQNVVGKQRCFVPVSVELFEDSCEGTAKYMLMQTFFLPESTGGQMQIVNEVSGFGLATDVTLILSIHMPSAE